MIIAGTGHRSNKLGGYSQAANIRLKEIALEFLSDPKCEVTKIISGMALGWDIALAEAALDLNIPLIAACPFEGQAVIWPEKSQKHYYSILDKATEIKIVSSGDYAAWKLQKRNEWMVDNCDMVLALWDGSKGGTYNCIQYAKNKEKLIINLYDVYKKKIDSMA